MGKHSERKRWSNGALISIMNANLSANQCWGPLSEEKYISEKMIRYYAPNRSAV